MLNPAAAKLLADIKTSLDKEGMINPGVIGLD